MKPSLFLAAFIASAVAIAGCSVKFRPGVDEALQTLESDVASMRRTEDGAGWNLEELEARARRVAASFGQGDPRWHRAMQTLGWIRETRQRASEREAERELDRLASEKLSELEGVVASVGAPRPKPDMTAIDAFIAQAEAESRQQSVTQRSRADADFDRPWARPAAAGDRGRDEEPIEPGQQQKPRRPLEVDRIVHRPPFAMAFISFTPEDRVVFGAVSGDFLTGQGASAGRIIVTFVERGFEPNWEDIYSSAGTAVTGGAVIVQGGGTVGLVAIGRVDAAPTMLRAELRTSDARSYRGEGP